MHLNYSNYLIDAFDIPRETNNLRNTRESLVGCRVKLTKEVPRPFARGYLNVEPNMYGTVLHEWPGESMYEILLDFDGFTRVRVGRDDFEIVCNTRKRYDSIFNPNSLIEATIKEENTTAFYLTSKGPDRMPKIEKVIFNDPCTIVIWSDKTKTIVRKGEGEAYDPEKGMAMAICKKALGTNQSLSNYYDIFKKYLPDDKEDK